ncbi:hypothetical protein M758_8G076600 [Ceratodon purpureus]|nr:hypothetical protein M758_8G076600 [Ceratodon purpureus]
MISVCITNKFDAHVVRTCDFPLEMAALVVLHTIYLTHLVTGFGKHLTICCLVYESPG